MSYQSITYSVNEACASVVQRGNTDLALVEAVGRSLGYTEKELALAADALSRFVWRYAKTPPENAPWADAKTVSSGSDRHTA
jgi:hypothetical protein